MRMDTGYKPCVAAPVPLIEVVTVLHRVQHQDFSFQIVITFCSDNVLVHFDLYIRTNSQSQFLIALHLLDDSLAAHPGLEGRPVPLPQVESSREIRVDAFLVALRRTLFKLFSRFARGSDLRRF